MDDEPERIVLPSEIARFFKNPAVLATEMLREYDSLFVGTARNIDPQNNLEWLSLRNYINSQWQIRRLQSAYSSIVDAAQRPALREILESILPETQERPDIAARMTGDWYENPTNRSSTLELLRRHGFNENSILARAMEMRAVDLERIDLQLQRHKLAATRHLKELEALRRCRFWRSTEDCGRGVKRHPGSNGNGPRAG